MPIPIIKKDALVEVSMNFNTIGAIVNGIFIIASSWSPEKMEKFKAKLQANNLASITDNDEITYIMLDSFYRTILKKATETNQIEMTEDTILGPLNP